MSNFHKNYVTFTWMSSFHKNYVLRLVAFIDIRLPGISHSQFSICQ